MTVEQATTFQNVRMAGPGAAPGYPRPATGVVVGRAATRRQLALRTGAPARFRFQVGFPEPALLQSIYDFLDASIPAEPRWTPLS